MIVKLKESSHWYTVGGEPRFNATLREARKENLLPSVTSVIKSIANPQLERWKQEQCILAAISTERSHDEPDLEFARRIATEAERKSSEAAEVGTILHGLIARKLDGEFISLYEYDDKISSMFFAVDEWIESQGFSRCQAETSFASVDGYAGTIDCIADDVIIDWKTQGTRPGEKYRAYHEWCMQLAAYGAVFYDMPTIPDAGYPPRRCMNVIVSTTEPGRLDVHEWKREEIVNGFETFKIALALWRAIKKFPWRCENGNS